MHFSAFHFTSSLKDRHTGPCELLFGRPKPGMLARSAKKVARNSCSAMLNVFRIHRGSVRTKQEHSSTSSSRDILAITHPLQAVKTGRRHIRSKLNFAHCGSTEMLIVGRTVRFTIRCAGLSKQYAPCSTPEPGSSTLHCVQEMLSTLKMRMSLLFAHETSRDTLMAFSSGRGFK